MINRVLIRMKTVQLLYSYMLVEKPFSLESQPSSPTKEKRFAYRLYLDMIYLIDRLALKITGKNKTLPLSNTRFVLRTESDEHIKSLKVKYNEEPFPFSEVEGALAENIKDSLLFRDFEKKKGEGILQENFWEEVFNAIIIVDPGVNEVIQKIPGYSLSGVDKMKEMMALTFRNFYSSRDNVDDALKTLEASMQQARNLYMRLLDLPVELTALHRDNLELGRSKHLATIEDKNPNMKLANNLLADKIAENRDFNEYVEKHHLSWRAEDPELLERLLKAVIDSDIYKTYIGSREKDIRKDVEFWREIFLNVVLNNEDFLEYLENKSVFWNDDLEIMMSFVLKTFKRFESSQTEESAVLPMYKDGNQGKDAKFGVQLFNYVVRNKDLYHKYIEEALKRDKWEAD